MTEARADFLGALLKTPSTCQFVLVAVECQFKKPYFHPDTIIVKQFAKGVANSSFSLAYEFYSKKDPGTLYATGLAKMVAFDPEKKRAIRVPELVRNRLLELI